MGMDLYTYVGAFFKIPTQYEEYNKVKRKCGEHKVLESDIYCSTCGSEIEEVISTHKRVLDCEDLIGNESFFSPYIEGEITYFLTNISSSCQINTDSHLPTVITPELIQEKILNFEKTHKKDIELMKKKTGCEIKVEFGFLNYYM